MTSKIILFAAASGIVLATGASALPLNPLRGDNSVAQVHVVCDEYGRCWEVSDDPGEVILHGLFGGSDHHHHDWDHHHHDWDHHHHDWDHHHHWDHDHHSDDDD